MRPHQHDHERPVTLPSRLRREARATRPGFSMAFHERLMERIVSEAGVSPRLGDGSLRARVDWKRTAAAWAAAGFVAALVAMVVARIPPGAAQSGTRAEASLASSAADSVPPVGIEGFPMYDDIDAGMRTGVWILASTLVEVPDWASLAGFDAAVNPPEAATP